MKRLNCRKLIYTSGFVAGILFILISCDRSAGIKFQSEIDKLSAKWVPDQRVGICSIKVKSIDNRTILLTGETTCQPAKDEIIKTLNNRGITLIDSILILPDTAGNDKYMGLVTLSVINLRKKPDHRSELISQSILGTPVLILKNENSWVLIQTPDKYISWTEKSSLELMTPVEMNDWKESDRVIFRNNTGWIYDSSPDHSGVVSDIVAGCILIKTGESNAYTKVSLPDRRQGLIESKELMDFNSWESTINYTPENVCRVALSFLGVPYLWGGTSPKGVDCSGFVSSVYFMSGLILSRDASLQALHGNTIDISDGFGLLDKGDLLFFGSKANGTSHVTHVGIYIGNNEYINSSGRVMINSLDSTQAGFNRYRMNSLLGAKRIIGGGSDEGIVPVIKHPWY